MSSAETHHSLSPSAWPEEEQETSGDFGSGGSVVLLDDLEDAREPGPKDQLGRLRAHTRATEDDEDEDDDKEDEVGYIW